MQSTHRKQTRDDMRSGRHKSAIANVKASVTIGTERVTDRTSDISRVSFITRLLLAPSAYANGEKHLGLILAATLGRFCNNYKEMNFLAITLGRF